LSIRQITANAENVILDSKCKYKLFGMFEGIVQIHPPMRWSQYMFLSAISSKKRGLTTCQQETMHHITIFLGCKGSSWKTWVFIIPHPTVLAVHTTAKLKPCCITKENII
jgi:hypothetical protein